MESREFNWEKAAKRLWDILDNIDTATDTMKPDNSKSFTQYVYKQVAKRFEVMKSDGYNSYPNKEFE